jgi:uncharacterized membrane protein YgcG
MTLTTLFAALIATAPVPPATGFVNDQADVLTPAEEAAIIAVCEDLERVTTIEVAVLTMPSIDSETPREFATKALNAWGVGKAGKDNGVLLLLAKQERRVEIEVGYGLEGELTDGLSGELLDAYVIPRFKEGRFGQGLVDGVTGIARLLSSGRVQGPRAGAASPPSSMPASAPPIRHPVVLPLSPVDAGLTMPLRWWLAVVLALGFLLAVTLHKDPNKPFVPWTMWLLLIPLAVLGLPVVLSFGLAPLWVNTLTVAVWAWWIRLCIKTKPWLTTCSKCAKRQVSSTTQTVVSATYSSGGQDRVTETCGACGHTTSSLRNTPRKTRSSSTSSYGSSSGSSYRSSSSSSSSSRSFGGGSSGGGGAGRSW